jgi:hypothetical protein
MKFLYWKIYIFLELLVLLHQGASAVHFHDFNAEVLRCLTIPNVNANLSVRSHCSATKEGSAGTEGELCFFVGEYWSQSIYVFLTCMKRKWT